MENYALGLLTMSYKSRFKNIFEAFKTYEKNIV